jgi:hypothetical protein
MNTRNRVSRRRLSQIKALDYWKHLKDKLWLVRYEHPATQEVMFGTEESMREMEQRGSAPLVVSGGIRQTPIAEITPLTWEEFLRQYKIELVEED